MQENKRRVELPEVVAVPNYDTLIDWWELWPEAKPVHLDFWARGNYVRHLLSRKDSQRSGCIVRVEYLDEIEFALKRLALLGLKVDFVWHGMVSEPQLVIVPQDVDYEDSGGWGYTVAAGDKFSEQRGGKEWCPAIGWASLLPDTVTEWLGTEAKEFVRSGDIFVAPVQHLGLSKHPGGKTEEEFQRISESMTLMGERAKIKAIFKIDLPYLEGMGIKDVKKFCDDYKDSLMLFQGALHKLVKQSPQESEYALVKELVAEIKEGIAILTLSDKAANARKLLLHVGAAISSISLTIGLRLGIPPSEATVGIAAAASGLIGQYSQILESRAQMKKNPFYAIWAFQKGKGPKNTFYQHKLFDGYSQFKLAKKKGIPPYHWLSPPTPGWIIPTAFRG